MGEDKPSNDNEKKDGNTEEEIGPMVSFSELFRYADSFDWMLILVGTIAAFINGASIPLMLVVFGEISDVFIEQGSFAGYLYSTWDYISNITDSCVNATIEEAIDNPGSNLYPCLEGRNDTLLLILKEIQPPNFLDQVGMFSLYFTILGGVVWFFSYIQVVCFQMASYRQCQRIRTCLFHSILHQEIAWFDTNDSGELNTRLSSDVGKIQEGIGEKCALLFQWISTFFAGFIVGFVYGWKLTLVIIGTCPALMISGTVLATLGARISVKELEAYAKAGAIAEEVFSCLRTVVAFNGQEKEITRYNTALEKACKFDASKGLVSGFGFGLVYFLFFGVFGLAFWYGSQLYLSEGFSAGDLLVVLFAVITGAFSLGNAAPNIETISRGRGAAYTVYQIIERRSAIDSSSTSGKSTGALNGNIEFIGVTFNYPARPDVTVLKNFSLKISKGQTVALVGASGCGKSTVVQLVQRFYDLDQGQVLLDSMDVKSLNVNWLRKQIGVVSQEPILFQSTIEENIRFGKENATEQEIIQAAKDANIHKFISGLPKGYQTMVGERGAQLSGGQKQRIAIARALVRDPKILLLDEATSALDTESEALVQEAIYKAAAGRTTIIVAHRLSTVQNVDQIFGLLDGQVVESGTHDQLIQKQGGIYYTLYTNQTLKTDLPVKTETKKDGDTSSLKSSGSKDKLPMRRRSSHASALPTPVLHLEDDEKAQAETYPEVSFFTLMRENSPECGWIMVGCLGGLMAGIAQPAFALQFSEFLGAFALTDEEEFKKEVNFYVLLVVLVGVGNGLGIFLQNACFSYSGAHLTKRLRERSFKALLRQEVSYYDNPRNSTGALCTRLSADASAVQGATGIRLGTAFHSLSAIGAGLAAGFYYSWELSLFIFAFVPFMILGGFLQMQVFLRSQASDSLKYEEAGKVAIESIENIRTVAMLTQEDHMSKTYERLTNGPTQNSIKQSHMQGLSFGFSSTIIFFAYAACFYMGGYLIDVGRITYEEMFKVFTAIIFSAQSVGEASSFAPDYSKAKISASKIFALSASVPSIDIYSTEGLQKSPLVGDIGLQDVVFSYPTRPFITVMNHINLQIPHGLNIALVGSSGCGKSTIIQLIERFYDPSQGQVQLDLVDIRDMNLNWLRSQMSLVSQEPVLFDCSIEDNISYGDNSRVVSTDEIIRAAKKANIHMFISSLPNGYKTNVGSKGTQLSGGQKQRIAIARALVSNPKILLLDEATSALDTESEKVVQEALNKAQEGRTSVVIAHRLATIQNCHKILVIDTGEVAESGTHSELLQKKGIYHRLYLAQERKST